MGNNSEKATSRAEATEALNQPTVVFISQPINNT